VRETGRSRSGGHRRAATRTASPLRPAGLRADGAGREPGGPRDASWEVESVRGRAEPGEDYKSRGAARAPAAPPRPGTGHRPSGPPPLAELRRPPAEGRLRSAGWRWVRRGPGSGGG
jgi:hypothetical protein